MKTITLYEYGKSTFQGWKSWWSAKEPQKVLGSSFIEHTDTGLFTIPEPWVKIYIDGEDGRTLYHDTEFEAEDGREGHLETNAEGNPVICEELTGKHHKLTRNELT